MSLPPRRRVALVPAARLDRETGVSTCRSCGAEIVWAYTERGRRMPLSVASLERRFVITGPALDAVDDPTVSYVETYVSHFADCPNADKHRKPKPPAAASAA